MERLALLTILVGACSPEVVTVSAHSVPEPRFSDIQALVFTPSCTFNACHDADQPAGRLDLTEGAAYISLIGAWSTLADDRRLVIPLDPTSSFLVDKLRGTLADDEGDPMPLHHPPLPEETIQAIETWILSGARPN